jgi:ABC-type transport system involved in multi-copper enzyme maturation permease subunit
VLRHIYLFELRSQLRSPLLWVTVFVFMLLTFGAVVSDKVSIGESIGNVNRNAPYVTVMILAVMSVVGVFAVTAFVGTAACRDFDSRAWELVFSKPFRRRDYMIGHFAGAWSAAGLVMVASAAAMIVASFMPWLGSERLGPSCLTPYVWGLAAIALPNFLFAGALFFTLSGVTRSMLYTYLGVVALFVTYSVAGHFVEQLDQQIFGALLDPFGLAALEAATKYWTVAEKNSIVPPLDGVLVANRLIWAAVGAAIFWAGAAFVGKPSPRRAGRRRAAINDEAFASALPARVRAAARTNPDFGRGARFAQFAAQTKLETVAVLRSAPFIVIVLFGMLNVLGGIGQVESMYGTPVHPVTHLMLGRIENGYVFFLAIVLTFYAGELVWRERSRRMHEVMDVLPVPNAVPLASKAAALLAIAAVFLFFGVVATCGYQLSRGYTHLEPLLYVKGLFLIAYPFLLVAVLAFFVQVASGSRFFGYLLMILYLLSTLALDMLGLEHRLYHFAGISRVPYSDMNGFGHFLVPWFWFGLYWTFFAAVLMLLATLFWQRGTGDSWRERLASARRRFGRRERAALAATLAGFTLTGAWIFYNTNVRNHYLPSKAHLRIAADYERRYGRYRDIAQPRITAVDLNVDVDPLRRAVRTRGVYRAVNKGSAPIDSVHVSIAPGIRVERFDFGGENCLVADSALGYYVYALDEPLRAGDTLEFSFGLAALNPGFVNSGSNTSVVRNGTFFDSKSCFPTIGYDANRRLVDPNDRRKHGLPSAERMAKVDDLFARRNNQISSDADWIAFRATVSTDTSQIAVAPGYLKEEWVEGERRFFRYEMDAPILNYYAFLSADYEVRRERWNDVAIEIDYHRGHEYNVDRMVDAIRKSLAYYSAAFGPYQHRQVRMVEFPLYRGFAQSFPNTIPFSEAIGFIADLENEESIDYVFYVTAHEVAHQWWAHQVIGGNVQGATMITETLAQYSALMVMEKEYGPEKMRKFLQYEMDRYLRGRGAEAIEEMPLLLVEDQPYIHYRKGSVVLYALRDYIGEAALNAALAAYIDSAGFQNPPWTSSLECFRFLEAATPDSLRPFLNDAFETITLFDNRVEDVRCTESGDGRFTVALDLRTKKMHADGKGTLSDIPVDDPIDVGVFGAEGEVLYLTKHRFTGSETTLEVAVTGVPQEAGIDPYNKLIDRNSDDNRKKIVRGP